VDGDGAKVEVIEPLTRVTTVVRINGLAPVQDVMASQRFVVRLVAGHTLSGHRIVTTNDDGALVYADHDDMSQLNRPVWLVENAWSTGDLATAVAQGPAFETSWSWTPGLAVFIGSEGQLTQTPPSTGWLRKIASVAEVQGIWFDPQPPIVLS
jgi:hypothetical protein